jgi:trk system potassium uptake protein TrkH
LSLGWIVLAVAAAEALMAGVAFAADDGLAEAFAAGAAVTAMFGGGAILATKGRRFEFSFRDAVILTVSAWFVLPLFAAVPLLFGPEPLTPVDALFEMVSAITTTGSTVLTGLDAKPASLLLWRSTMQWFGGFGIIGLAIVILPFLKIGGMQLFRLESSDTGEKYLPRVRATAQALAQVYLGLTVLCFAAYLFLGMTPFDAINHAFTTVCTGGFSTHDASFGYFEDPALQWASVIFMLAGAVPFLAYLKIAGRGRLRDRIEPQVFVFLAVTALAALTIFLWLAISGRLGVGEALTESTFNVVSVITSTGYASSDYSKWGAFATMAFFLFMFLGGCTGSTSGGIKILRYQILAATVFQHVRQTIYPHIVHPVRYGGRTVGNDQIVSVGVFVFLYFATFACVAIAFAVTGLDTLDAVSAAASAIGNIGPALGPVVGPVGTFASLSDFQKLLMSFAMVLGRLEILSVLVLLAPSFYR